MCILLAIFLIILGIYVIIIFMKYYERFKFHIAREMIVREFVDEKYLGSNVNKLMRKSKLNHNKKYCITYKVRLYFSWYEIILFLEHARLQFIYIYNVFI